MREILQSNNGDITNSVFDFLDTHSRLKARGVSRSMNDKLEFHLAWLIMPVLFSEAKNFALEFGTARLVVKRYGLVLLRALWQLQSFQNPPPPLLNKEYSWYLLHPLPMPLLPSNATLLWNKFLGKNFTGKCQRPRLPIRHLIMTGNQWKVWPYNSSNDAQQNGILSCYLLKKHDTTQLSKETEWSKSIWVYHSAVPSICFQLFIALLWSFVIRTILIRWCPGDVCNDFHVATYPLTALVSLLFDSILPSFRADFTLRNKLLQSDQTHPALNKKHKRSWSYMLVAGEKYTRAFFKARESGFKEEELAAAKLII